MISWEEKNIRACKDVNILPFCNQAEQSYFISRPYRKRYTQRTREWQRVRTVASLKFTCPSGWENVVFTCPDSKFTCHGRRAARIFEPCCYTPRQVQRSNLGLPPFRLKGMYTNMCTCCATVCRCSNNRWPESNHGGSKQSQTSHFSIVEPSRSYFYG